MAEYFRKPTPLPGILSISLLVISIPHAQPAPLGWEGTRLLPNYAFVNSTNWAPHTSNPADSVRLSFDSSSVTLTWSFSAIDGFKYSIGTFSPAAPLNLDTFDIFGFDFKGGPYCASCLRRVSVEFKFEGVSKTWPHAPAQSGIVLDGAATNARWIERMALPKSLFHNSDSLDWTHIRKISMGVNIQPKAGDNGAMAGTISFRNLVGDRAELWPRPTAFTPPNPTNGAAIAQKAIAFFLANQDTASGILYTWPHEKSSNLYGLGLILKLLASNGCWNNGLPNSVAHSAGRLAKAISVSQHADGYFARSWRSGVPAYDPDRVWLGDQPWAVTGLGHWIKRSRDSTYYPHYRKGVDYLKSAVQADTTLRVWSFESNQYVREESMEAYAALLQAMMEAGETQTANKLVKYILDHGWDSKLKYFREAANNPRPVLFTNVWLAEIFRRRGRQDIALAALGFIGKAMYTRGPKGPDGLDGFGPYATWFEGITCYAGAGGPGSAALFTAAADSIRPDGGLPAYNEDFYSYSQWRTTKPSADATLWLYWAASGLSAFDTSYAISCPSNIGAPRLLKPSSPNPSRIYDYRGVFLGLGHEFDAGGKKLPPGIYFELPGEKRVFKRVEGISP